jgi:hypothetical protein
LHDFAQYPAGLFLIKRGGPSWSRGFRQSGQSEIDKPLPPKSGSHRAGFQRGGNLVIVTPLRRQRYNPGAPHNFLRSRRRLDESLQFAALLDAQL